MNLSILIRLSQVEIQVWFLNHHLTGFDQAEEARVSNLIRSIDENNIRFNQNTCILNWIDNSNYKIWLLVESLVIPNFVFQPWDECIGYRRICNLNFQKEVSTVRSLEEQTHRTLTYYFIYGGGNGPRTEGIQ